MSPNLSILGIYHQVTPKHLSRYCDETMYRYNTRKIKDHERFSLSLQQSVGRLDYKTLTAKKEETYPVYPTPYITAPGRKTTPIFQLKYGKPIHLFPSIAAACKATGIGKRAILKVLRGKKRTTGGFGWKYE